MDTIKLDDLFILDTDFYEENYNSVRRCKLILFSSCLGRCPTLTKQKEYNRIKKKKKMYKTFMESIKVPKYASKTILRYLVGKVYSKEHIVKNLERQCLNKALNKAKLHNIRCIWQNESFVNIYHGICYKIACNIDENSVINSSYIKNKILNGEVFIEDVVNMSSRELCPKKYEKIDKKIQKRYTVEQKVKYSELYECPKCKRTRCTIANYYNRGLDEGVSLKITCYCGYYWIE